MTFLPEFALAKALAYLAAKLLLTFFEEETWIFTVVMLELFRQSLMPFFVSSLLLHFGAFPVCGVLGGGYRLLDWR